MKKIIILFVALACLANVSAQFKVNSLGKTVIGTNSPTHKLNVDGDTYVSGDIYMGSASNSISTTNNVPITFKVNSTSAGFTGTSLSSNVSFGFGSNPLTTGQYNTAIGAGSLQKVTTSGRYNTAIGSNALYSNTSGYSNTANGSDALRANTTGVNNTASGDYALGINSTGSANTAVGVNALSSNSTGTNNTAVGVGAFNANATGSYNTAIGASAAVSTGNLSNATAIGYGAIVNASNKVVIGNSSVASASIGVIWSVTSDGRAKKNIRAEVPGLAFIKQLQPVMYNMNLDALDELQKSDDPKINAFNDSVRNARSPEEKAIETKARADKEKIVYSGFIAQDVEKAARSVGYDFSGVDAPENGKGVYGLRYAEFVVPLVKAVQELSEQNARLQEQINELKYLANMSNNPALKSESDTAEEEPVLGMALETALLYQNIPNPFNQSTEIKFYIPENSKKAQLYIYNLQGKQIKQMVIAERGESSHRISASELTAGMYLYALIVDGKEVDTKRMILTK